MKGSKRLKLEADDKVWGEQVDHCQVQLMSGATDKAQPKHSQSSQLCQS